MLKKHAFLEYGVVLRPDISSVSGFSESPRELVLSLWEHDFNKDFSRYHGHIASWKGPGEKKFRNQVREANRERIPIRVVLATSQQPELVRAGRAVEADNDFVPRFDLVGRLIQLDRDEVVFAFEKTGERRSTPAVEASPSIPEDLPPPASSEGNSAKYWHVVEAIESLGTATLAEVVNWLEQQYPGDPLGNARADLELLTVNSPSRPHYNLARDDWRSDTGHRHDRLFKLTDPGPPRRTQYTLFNPAIQGHVDLQKSADGKWEVIPLSLGEIAQAEAEGQSQATLPPIDSDHDARVWAMKAIAQRQGQSLFRSQLIEAYEGRCAVTGSNATSVLEAAHVKPYRGAHTNRLDNGLLLRSDIHTLFDLGLLWIEKSRVVVAPALKGTDYEAMHGVALRLPAVPLHHPNPEHMAEHAHLARERQGLNPKIGRGEPAKASGTGGSTPSPVRTR